MNKQLRQYKESVIKMKEDFINQSDNKETKEILSYIFKDFSNGEDFAWYYTSHIKNFDNVVKELNKVDIRVFDSIHEENRHNKHKPKFFFFGEDDEIFMSKIKNAEIKFN